MKLDLNLAKSKFFQFIKYLKSLSLLKKLILLTLIIAAIFFLRPKKDETAISYQTRAATLGQVSQIISETGEIMSTGKTDINSTITGIVAEVYVDNGNQVQKNQNLFKVVSSATAEERAQAYASYLAAKNSLDSAKRNQQSFESDMWQAHEDFESRALDTDLSVDDPIYIQTDRDWQAAEKKYLDQEEVIKQAQAALNSAWLAYQATIDGIVKAPIAGTVANLSVSVGQQVNASDAALLISSSADTWVKLAVSEADVINLAAGQKAIVSVDAIKNSSFSAQVERVDEFGTDNSGVITYNVYLVLLDSADQIRPAMTVQVDITTQSKDEVLVVPNSAIKPYQGAKAVQILSKKTGQVVYLPVEIGIEGEDMVEIISGLELGQEVVVGQSATGFDSKNNKNNGIFPVPGGGGGH